ncbi:MAG TPA: response regulator transcription factor [Bacteroidia bacterium]|jgi:DNA-binding NarL/FixJ family response regulator|nr:response regulator transcription factor [Bacteroidia bacterium]
MNIIVADNSVLMREGFKALMQASYSVNISEVTEKSSLLSALKKHKPEILVIDPVSMQITPTDISQIKKQFKALQILAISPMLPKEEISSLLNAGVTSFLLKECDKQEICDAIDNTEKGTRFLCGQIIDALTADAETVAKTYSKKTSCEGFAVSDREIEIIKHIALGLSNKQIAEKLFLSFHTVHTHRKNVMQKLRVNNTAGVVMFAVKNNLLVDEEIHTN